MAPGGGWMPLTPEDVAVLAVRRAVEAGATEAEAYVVQVRGYEAYANNNRVNDARGVNEAGVGIRVAVGKRLGYSYASSLDPGEIAEAARRAVKAARVAREDPEWRGLPEPSSVYPEPEAIYDSSLARVRPEKVVELLDEMIDEATGFEGVIVNRAYATIRLVRRAIASTSGVYRIDTGTYAYEWILVLANRDGVVTPLHYREAYGRVSVPSPRLLARTAAEEITRSFKTAKIDSPRRMSIVLTPVALGELFANTVAEWLRGDNIVRGVSPLAGRLGEQVLDEKLTIIDDGTLRQGFHTWRFDGEGVAMQRTVLVEKGVFKSPVYDSYWAARAGAESTGNAMREGYTRPPRIGYTNVVIERGDASIDELLEGEVLLVAGVQGAHSSNPHTGEYSVVAAPAWLVKNGEYYLARGVMVAGKLLDQLSKSLEAVGSWHEDLAGLRAPWIRLGDAVVTPRQ